MAGIRVVAPGSSVGSEAADESTAAASILHLHAAGSIGGAGRVVQLLASAQKWAGHDVMVGVVLDQGAQGEAFCRPLETAGVGTRRWEVPPRRYDIEYAAVSELCKDYRPGVVHTHSYRADVVGGRAARRLGIPVVSTAHGFTGGGWKNRVYQTIQCRSLRRFDAVVAVSRPLASELARRGVPGDRIHVIPNAYPEAMDRLEPEVARDRLGLPTDTFHLGWIGRVTPEKGLDVMLAALRELGDLSITLSVIGDGRERPALEADAADLTASGRIRWHGTVQDAGTLLPAFDVFVLSSRTEGTPMVLLEAMSAGVPVVVTAVGGVPDVVSEREALLAPPEDPRALADAIRSVLQDKDRASKRAVVARTRLEEEYGAALWVQRHRKIYSAVLKGRP